MASLRQIKRRIKTARNIGQVTRAMEMVSAVKMRKVQESALSGRPYIFELEKMVRVLASQKNLEEKHPYLVSPSTVRKIAVLVVAPQKGLCGALITNLARTVVKFVDFAKTNTNISGLLFCPDEELACPLIKTADLQISFVSLEKKAADMVKSANYSMLANFSQNKKNPTLGSIQPVADFLVKLFEEKQADLILVAYSHFVNTMTQKPVIRQFLPILPSAKKSTEQDPQFLFEPTAEMVLKELLLRYCETVLYQIVLEGLAAEHSARMVAMKNAHDNASEIIDDLTLYYNKARQEAITNELTTTAGSFLEAN